VGLHTSFRGLSEWGKVVTLASSLFCSQVLLTILQVLFSYLVCTWKKGGGSCNRKYYPY